MNEAAVVWAGVGLLVATGWLTVANLIFTWKAARDLQETKAQLAESKWIHADAVRLLSECDQMTSGMAGEADEWGNGEE